MSSSSSSSTCSSSSGSSSSNSIDVYSSTIFNYLNDFNQLEYLALADFTLKFPVESDPLGNGQKQKNKRNASKYCQLSKRMRVSEEENDHDDEDLEEEATCDSSNSSSTKRVNLSNLKYLFLRNIRNIKSLTSSQVVNLRSFLSTQFNLHTLDLIGLYVDSNFICSILSNLNNLR